MSTKRNTGNHQNHGFYSTYRFRATEKDPVIDQIRSLMDDTDTSISELSTATNLSQTTIRNWIDGDTRKPQHASITAAVRGMGFDFALVPLKRNIGKGGLAAAAPRFVTGAVDLVKRFVPQAPGAHHVARATARFNDK